MLRFECLWSIMPSPHWGRPVGGIVTSPEKTLLDTDLVGVGMFRCPPDHERFPGGIVNHHLVVFPRTAVRIEREATPPVVADPTVAVLYDPPSRYRRRAVDPRGDFCDFFAISRDATDDLSAAVDIDAAAVFRQGSGRASASVYLTQRRLFELAAADDCVDRIAIEEGVLAMVERMLRETHSESAPGHAPRHQTTSQRHRHLANDAAEFIAAHFTERLLLSHIAFEVGSSPYHLARVFRRMTGTSIHERLLELRLKAALGLLRDGASDIAMLATELGFSSHGHLTRAFKTAFGLNPSEYREELPQIRTILQASPS